MRLLVSITVYDEIVSEDDVLRARKVFAESWRKMLDSGKVECSGIYGNARGGFLVVDVDSAEDLWSFPVPSLLDYAHVEVHPVMDTERFMGMFKELMSGSDMKKGG